MSPGDSERQTGDLFGDQPDDRMREEGRGTGVRAPLADRMRPRSFDEVVGQPQLVAPGRPLREAIERDTLQSIILWGPPGSGKTTIARVIATLTRARFVAFSAVLAGIKEIREVMAQAEDTRRRLGRRTILFIDEIHRFNKAQQDAFLPRVEAGDIVLIGATTENPSFEVNAALLSRSRVFVLQPLTVDDVLHVLRRALADRERGLGDRELDVAPEALSIIAQHANGDARVALNLLELAAAVVSGRDVAQGKPDVAQGRPDVAQGRPDVAQGRPDVAQGKPDVAQGFSPARIDVPLVEQVIQRRALLYDKAGEEHYNVMSALHKSMRNSDPDAAVYWLARMLEAGEDPLYVARRLVRFASEDVGNADPQALGVAVAAKEAVHFIGMPEGNTALAQAAIYLATAPKSNAVYVAYSEAAADAHRDVAEPVPLHLRNAPTGLMRDIGYGKGYRYAHDEEEGIAAMECLPPALRGRRYYLPTDRGFEREVRERLMRWAESKKGSGGRGQGSGLS